jgi:signal peptidase II
VDPDEATARAVTPARRWALVLGALVVVLVIDQWSKRWALGRLAPEMVGGPREVIEVIGPLQFNLAFNTGASFSMGSGSGALIGVIATVIVVVLALMARKVTSRAQLVLIGLIMGGALGNIVDRVTRAGATNPITGEVSSGFMSGAVVDFIDVQFWPIWNVADMAVVVGGISLAVLSVFAPAPGPDAELEPEAASEAESEPGAAFEASSEAEAEPESESEQGGTVSG